MPRSASILLDLTPRRIGLAVSRVSVAFVDLQNGAERFLDALNQYCEAAVKPLSRPMTESEDPQ